MIYDDIEVFDDALNDFFDEHGSCYIGVKGEFCISSAVLISGGYDDDVVFSNAHTYLPSIYKRYDTFEEFLSKNNINLLRSDEISDFSKNFSINTNITYVGSISNLKDFKND